MNRERIGKAVFYCGLLVLAASMPLSVFGMSVSQFMIAAGWLIEGNYSSRLKKAIANPVVIVLCGVYFIHLIGAFYSSNLSYLLNDLRIKLPLLVLPVLMASSEPLSDKIFFIFLGTLVAAVFVSTLISTGVWLGWLPHKNPINDIRNISVFISHIRLSLLICFSIFICLYFFTKSRSGSQRTGLILMICWLLAFMYILEAMTGFAVLISVILLMLFAVLVRSGKSHFKTAATITLIAIPALLFLFIRQESRKLFCFPVPQPSSLEMFTANGNSYLHSVSERLPGFPYLNPKMQENCTPVAIYICEKELRDAWNQRSRIPFDEKDHSGFDIKYTLVRFLASKGLRKDSAGVYSLSSSEIEAIESGIANVNYQKKGNLRTRIDKTIMEYYGFRFGQNPSGSTMLQRLEYWKTGWTIFINHFFTGVGSGDVQDAFNNAYQDNQSPLSPDKRLRAHNQFLTMGITFGIFGLLYFIFSLIYPYCLQNKSNDFLYSAFILIVVISMFTEDTLETQAGVTFYTLLNSVFLFLRSQNSPLPASR